MELTGEENLHVCPATIRTYQVQIQQNFHQKRKLTLPEDKDNGLKDCSDDCAIQSHMAVKALVGTDELPPDSAGVQPSFISVEFDFP